MSSHQDPPSRRRDDGRTLSSYSGRVLVVCPRCEGCAQAVLSENCRNWTCVHCGYHATRDASIPEPDELWLATYCDGHLLWAFNEEHLAALEAFIAAPLRERRRSPESGWSNSSLGSRAPRWMTSAKRRDKVLQALARLRDLLGAV